MNTPHIAIQWSLNSNAGINLVNNNTMEIFEYNLMQIRTIASAHKLTVQFYELQWKIEQHYFKSHFVNSSLFTINLRLALSK